MCQSENFWHIIVGILRRISPFQRSAALGGPFFILHFFIEKMSTRKALECWLVSFLRRALGSYKCLKWSEADSFVHLQSFL